MARPRPSVLDTSFFRGMYDPDEMISRFERDGYAPFLTDPILPLCVTRDNVEDVVKLLVQHLDIRYVRSLQRLAELTFGPEDLLPTIDSPLAAHYALDGAVDPRYATGLDALRTYIRRHGYLEHPLDTTGYRGLDDPGELIERIASEGHPPSHAIRLLPLAVTEANAAGVLRRLGKRLGRAYLKTARQRAWILFSHEADRASPWMDDLPANRHYLRDGAVDPKYLAGVAALRPILAGR